MPSKLRSEAAAERAAHAAAHDWPLPAAPYLPGLTPRPPGDDDVHRVAALAPDPTEPERWRENAAYLAGFRLHNAGYGWEAHEVWEPVWMHAQAHSGERHLLQGLIQLANARLKQRMRRDKAARRLLGIAAECLETAAHLRPGLVMGVDAGALHERVRVAAGEGEMADHALNVQYIA